MKADISSRSTLSIFILVLLWQSLGTAIQSARAAEDGQRSREILDLGYRVYQVNCAICHGVDGDGNGRAASMFRIRPRDFRPGIYKFRSTPYDSLPTDDDLLRTVTQGLRWTAMVGRPDLAERDRQAVVQYIKTFSPRFAKEQPGKPVPVPAALPNNQQILAQGQRLYHEAGCVACHGENGRGDGPAAQGLKDSWGWPIWPSDLTWRPLKRGSDLNGIYLTIVTGIAGTPMPSYANSLNGRQAWALVDYLDSLVPASHRLDPQQILGEEQQGWMVLRMGMMMGHGMMGPGMMYLH